MNHSLSLWFLESSRSSSCLAVPRGGLRRVALAAAMLAGALAATAHAAPAAAHEATRGLASNAAGAAVPAAGDPAQLAAGSGAGGLADSVIAGILGGSARDAADAAFGTDNVDFAIRKGYVTKIGRMPPGIDRITGDLGSTRCDAQVKADGTIVVAGNCPGDKR